MHMMRRGAAPEWWLVVRDGTPKLSLASMHDPVARAFVSAHNGELLVMKEHESQVGPVQVQGRGRAARTSHEAAFMTALMARDMALSMTVSHGRARLELGEARRELGAPFTHPHPPPATWRRTCRG